MPELFAHRPHFRSARCPNIGGPAWTRGECGMRRARPAPGAVQPADRGRSRGVPTERAQSPAAPPAGREIPYIAAAAVIEAVPPERAVAVTRTAFERYAAGEWTMPPKVYLDSPPGDFRAMPARGDGVALLKWVTSFPDNPKRGLPVVTRPDPRLRRGDRRGPGGDRLPLGDLAADRCRGRGLDPRPGAGRGRRRRPDRLRRQRRLGRPLPARGRLRGRRLPRRRSARPRRRWPPSSAGRRAGARRRRARTSSSP